MSSLRKWLVILAAMLPQIFAWGISVAALPLWLVPWMKTFSASHGQIATASMCMLLGIGLFSPLMAFIAERICVRDLIAAGMILISATYVLLSRATAMWQITLLHALPLAAGLTLTGAMMGQILAVKLFHPKAGLAIGIVTMGPAAGTIVAPFVVSHLLSDHTWQTALVILAAAGAVLLPVVLVTIPKLSPSSPADQADKAQAPAVARLPAAAILTDRIFLGSVMMVMVLNILWCAVFYNLGPYLQDIGGDAASTAKILAATGIFSFFGTVAFPVLADRIDYRLILLLSVVLNGVGLALIASGASAGELLIIVPMMAMPVGGFVSLLSAIMAQRFGKDNFARANGLSLPFAYLGCLGPYIAGLGRDKFGDYPHTFAAMLGLLVIPAIGLFLVATAKGGRADLAGELPAGELQKEF